MPIEICKRHRKINCSFLIVKIKILSTTFLFLSPFPYTVCVAPCCPRMMADIQSQRQRRRQSSFCGCHIFFWVFSLSHNKSERLKPSVCRRQRVLYYLWATGRYVFQTQDYANCDLPKHTVLAIFSWNRIKATLKRRMRLICPCQGKRRHICERVISDSITAPF